MRLCAENSPNALMIFRQTPQKNIAEYIKKERI